ncbi:hypothetical protein KIL84_000310 [Mauremys mutica]|uniref:Uncharacterized protein n=1 Tax=Mauremys mutica TaxID=74926 RepID=A0A9D4B3A5_9SAUR|nr:hypothetical protein KIL84_000310 [Mauremys mutica]
MCPTSSPAASRHLPLTSAESQLLPQGWNWSLLFQVAMWGKGDDVGHPLPHCPNDPCAPPWLQSLPGASRSQTGRWGRRGRALGGEEWKDLGALGAVRGQGGGDLAERPVCSWSPSPGTFCKWVSDPVALDPRLGAQREVPVGIGPRACPPTGAHTALSAAAGKQAQPASLRSEHVALGLGFLAEPVNLACSRRPLPDPSSCLTCCRQPLG